MTRDRRPRPREQVVGLAAGVNDLPAARRAIAALEERLRRAEERIARLEGP